MAKAGSSIPALVGVTLRTPIAFEANAAMSAIPGGVVGAGTVPDGAQAKTAVAAGAKFLVSPGMTPELLAVAAELGVPILPGIATASEAMVARDRGLMILRFFPAGPAGGPNYLKAPASPLLEIHFCPAGGNLENAGVYLKLPNVIRVGGSWVAPGDAIKGKDWTRIERLARQAAAIRN